jgi:hypothetical protein
MVGWCRERYPAFTAPDCSTDLKQRERRWTSTHPTLMAAPTSQPQLMPGDRLQAGAPG